MKISAINNYLSNKSYLKIYKTINREDFVWFKNNDNFLFHTFISNYETLSNFVELCELFKEKIDKKIKTASVFLIPQRSDKKICLDFGVEPLTIIYDLTTCDGQTILPNNYKFKSNLLNETFYEEQEDILEMKRTKREQDRSQRHENRTFSNRTFAPKSNTTQQKGRFSQSGDILLSDIYATATTTQLDIINLDDSDEEVTIRKEKKLIKTRLPSIKSTKKKEIIQLEQDNNSKSASSDSDSSDSSSGSENGYRSDMDKSEIQALAHKVVRQCEDLSANLRKSLIQWESGGRKENTITAAAAGSSTGSSSSGNCVELTSIQPVENNSNK